MTAADPAAAPGGPRRFQARLLAGSALSALLAVAALTAAGQRPGGEGAVEPVVPVAPAELTGMALLAGCALHPGTANADFRQAVCTWSGGRAVMVTFTTEAGQRQWTAEAESYGQYLVGPRWAVGADPAVLARLRPRLGGRIEGSTAHRH